MGAREAHDIERILRSHKEQLAKEYGVSELGLFGSCLRNEAGPESDIDILVEFDRPIGFFRFLELEERLEAWLGAPVDLVTKASLKPRIGRRILSEVSML